LFLLTYCSKDDSNPTEQDLPEQGMLVNYTKISSYSKEQINSLIGMTPELNSQVSALYTVDLYSVVYKTQDPFGNITNASGLFVIPPGVEKALPLASYNHGTILRNTDVPSFMSYEAQIGVLIGSQGFAICLPDYLGLGSGSGLHPYIHAKTEASATIDMLRASRKLCDTLNLSLNNQLFLCGYSQGGHAAMATHKMIEEQYSAEFTVTASAPMAGPYDVSGTMYDILLKEQAYPAPGYLVYLLFAYNYVYQLYPNFDGLLSSPFNTSLSPYFTPPTTSGISTVESLLPSSKIPSAIITPAFLQTLKTDENNPFKVKLRENDLYDWTPKAPIQMCHCDGDQHVPYKNSQIARDHFIARGFTGVTLVNPLPGGTHSTCVIPSLIATINWFNSLKQ
ncbi:MAG: hypothetical protein NTV01_01415, partial [Bacteroidia bacterium]|nr:hypothetical protein [Bacteroidia bacterium]